MIPLKLVLSGFLSYRDPVELDFSSFDLACIAGPNGAGKSSLLDAITWALFGQARKRDDSLINTRCEAAEVVLTFAYEGNIYRVLRHKARDKTTVLEFNLLQNGGETFLEGDPDPQISAENWKPLTERTLRETEARIQETLRLDYETFINASFFLQGKADQFTQQRPGDRKRILSSILGLEIWEGYRRRAAERRREVESDIAELDGRLQEIQAELAEEETRKARLERLMSDLEGLAKTRASQETALESMKEVVATLEQQAKWVLDKTQQSDAAALRLLEDENRLVERQQERESFSEILGREADIRNVYTAWQQVRTDLERWEEVASRFRDGEKRRQEPLDQINAARATLNQERQSLLDQQDQIVSVSTEIEDGAAQLEILQVAFQEAESQLAERAHLQVELQAANQRLAEAKAENPRLKAEMEALKARIDQLSSTEGAFCPLCGAPLSPQERQKLIDELSAQGKDLGDRYRANKDLLDKADQLVSDLEGQIAAFSQLDEQQRSRSQEIAQLNSRLEVLEGQRHEWKTKGAVRLEQIQEELQQETFAAQARARLAEIDAELKTIGYDAAAHDAARQAETEGRAAESDLRSLESAKAAIAPLDREIGNLQTRIESQRKEVARLREEQTRATAELATAQGRAPDVTTAERELLVVQEQENRLRLEVGAARQKVLVLEDLKERRELLEAERLEYSSEVGRFKQLERAFGKDGVPALLIEGALPQIEAKANQVLDRLSMGNMSVRFVTQAAYKDKHREDLKETLDIQISDGAGVRDYEMFSGGEAFRVNFAIRLALSEVLASRAGARLQTLVIDEGFGSQDAQGRQRLIEAINLVRQDFAKILVITHIDELKEAFPVRVEVEKTPRGSILQLV
jgi:exonuclease SbcC